MTDDGLRTLPPSRSSLDRRGLLPWPRYIPLAILLLAALVATGVGLVVKNQDPSAASGESTSLVSTLPGARHEEFAPV